MNAKTAKVLRRINKEVFEKYKDDLEVEVDAYETTKKIITHYTQPDVYKDLDEKQKASIDKLVKAQEAGLLEGTKMEPNREVLEKFDKELSEAIDKAIESGEIPNPKSDKELKEFNKKVKKIKK